MTGRCLCLVLLLTSGCERDSGSIVAVWPPAPVAIEVPAPPPPPPAPKPFRPGVLVQHPRVRPSRVARWFAALDAEQRRDVRELCHLYAADPCMGKLPHSVGLHTDGDPERRRDELLAAFSTEQVPGIEPYCDRFNGHRASCQTPLVLSFDDRPVELAASPGQFAFRAGEPLATDWPTAATPWLALDRDGDGAITSGAELFGDATVLADGTTARDGFAALAALDDNGDGVIDARDRAFSALLVWTDRDGDRHSTRDELRPLAEVMSKISLAHDATGYCQRGNCEVRGDHIVDIYVRER